MRLPLRWQLLRKVTGALLVWPPLAGVAIALVFADIIPDDAARSVEWILVLVYAAAYALFLEAANRRRHWDPAQRGYGVLRRWWLRVPMLFGVGVMFGYCSFVWAYPWLATKAFGEMATIDAVVTGWQNGGGAGCAHPLIGHGLFVDGPRALCVPQNAREMMPPGTHLRIEGPQTVLGINADNFYIVKPSPAK